MDSRKRWSPVMWPTSWRSSRARTEWMPCGGDRRNVVAAEVTRQSGPVRGSFRLLISSATYHCMVSPNLRRMLHALLTDEIRIVASLRHGRYTSKTSELHGSCGRSCVTIVRAVCHLE